MGIMMTDLATILRRAGLEVVEVPGWKTRGSNYRGGQKAVNGVIAHHTATSDRWKGDYPSLRLVRDGRSDVPGPLANLGLGRSGLWYVIAAGRANHAGPVHARYRTTFGNGYSIGIEAEHQGTYPEWPREQYESYALGVVALAAHYDVPFISHREARPGKIDPSFPWAPFEAKVDKNIKAMKRGARIKPITSAPTPAGEWADGVLKKGDRGEAVRDLQGFMARVFPGYPTVKAMLAGWGVDGSFGNELHAVVREFQQRVGITADGVVGRNTLRHLARFGYRGGPQ